ncbi:DUF3613 domain-containing protein [Algiphilus sp.]|uniref:DUF3613 domain-containing protein n=1 Tax=Algiphilus sp. TaxID=1872431 RepID=UPI0025BED5CC|nr:DUF3613 domain-containing protein [Algiphilus sp.]MCK5768774.1 DUF3613 domain-containing protein [Algiphilus sp.]
MIRTRILRMVLPGLAAAVSCSAALADRGPDAPPVGNETRQWLDLQVSGETASRPPSGMDGEVAQRVWERYLKSFTHDIPESFERSSFVESGGN